MQPKCDFIKTKIKFYRLSIYSSPESLVLLAIDVRREEPSHSNVEATPLPAIISQL